MVIYDSAENKPDNNWLLIVVGGGVYKYTDGIGWHAVRRREGWKEEVSGCDDDNIDKRVVLMNGNCVSKEASHTASKWHVCL